MPTITYRIPDPDVQYGYVEVVDNLDDHEVSAFLQRTRTAVRLGLAPTLTETLRKAAGMLNITDDALAQRFQTEHNVPADLIENLRTASVMQGVDWVGELDPKVQQAMLTSFRNQYKQQKAA